MEPLLSDDQNFPRTIKHFLERHGKRPTWLAKRAGISHDTIRTILAGSRRWQWETQRRLERAMERIREAGQMTITQEMRRTGQSHFIAAPCLKAKRKVQMGPYPCPSAKKSEKLTFMDFLFATMILFFSVVGFLDSVLFIMTEFKAPTWVEHHSSFNDIYFPDSPIHAEFAPMCQDPPASLPFILPQFSPLGSSSGQ
ncbi:helix-turn-helix domain-containing protein [Candidatus Parcubacteria bacterium]|nr:helix-turn-helix domain-containing protein [Candidatus Parcubacteria bacterium]